VMRRMLSTRNLVILALFVALFVVSGLLGLKVPKPEVSLAAEPLFHLGPLVVTDSLFTSWVAMIVLIVIAYFATRRIPKDLASASNSDLVPKGAFQNLIEWLMEYMWRLVKEISGSWAARFFPIVMTIFLFVIVSNWIELIPGVESIGKLVPVQGTATTGLVAHGPFLTAQEAQPGQGYTLVPFFRPPSTDLNFTVALALIAVVLSQYFGLRTLGTRYLARFWDTSGFKSGAMMGLVQLFAGLLELLGEFTKIISFSFRLFGNIFGGDVLLAVMAFLIPYVASLPFYGLELFVGFIQAAVFMILTLVFFVNAVSSHGAEGHPA